MPLHIHEHRATFQSPSYVRPLNFYLLFPVTGFDTNSSILFYYILDPTHHPACGLVNITRQGGKVESKDAKGHIYIYFLVVSIDAYIIYSLCFNGTIKFKKKKKMGCVACPGPSPCWTARWYLHNCSGTEGCRPTQPNLRRRRFNEISRKKKSTARHTALRSTSRAITVLDSTAVPAKLLENREIPHNCTYIL